MDTEFEALKIELKALIIEECEKEDITPEDVPDDVELFSPQSGLELDSLDALQISMALQNRYKVRLADPKEFRRVVSTTNALATYIMENR